MRFKKNRQDEPVIKDNKSPSPDESPKLEKAKDISLKYAELGLCCTMLSKINRADKKPNIMEREYWAGWRLHTLTIRDAGIDIEKIYTFIEQLAKERKQELERELSRLDDDHEGGAL